MAKKIAPKIPDSVIVLSNTSGGFPESWIELIRQEFKGCNIHSCRTHPELIDALKSHPNSVILNQTFDEPDLRKTMKLFPHLAALHDQFNFKMLLLNGVANYPAQRRVSDLIFLDIAQLPITEKAFYHKVDQLLRIVRVNTVAMIRTAIGDHVVKLEPENLPVAKSLPKTKTTQAKTEPVGGSVGLKGSSRPVAQATAIPAIDIPRRDYHLILISEREDDFQFAAELARRIRCRFHMVTDAEGIAETAQSQTRAIILWDAEGLVTLKGAIHDHYPPDHVFALADDYGQGVIASENSVYTTIGGCIYRKFGRPIPHVLSILFEMILHHKPAELREFFDDSVKVEMVKIRGPAQRKAIVEAMGTFFNRRGVHVRITRVLATAAEELLLHLGLQVPESESGVQPIPYLELMANDEYVGISVTGHFGHINPSILPMLLTEAPKVPPKNVEQEHLMGLNAMLGSGLSVVLFPLRDGQTAIRIFCTRTPRFTEYKRGFQFLSLITGRPVGSRSSNL